MSKEFEVRLPKLGESIMNASVVQWFKKEGDRVVQDESLLEVATDKVNSEIPSPVTGILKTIQAKAEAQLEVGDVLAIIELEKAAEKQEIAVAQKERVAESSSSEMKGYYSPALLHLAHEKGIGVEELKKITGTGTGARVTKQDLESYIEKKKTAKNCPFAPVISEDVEQIKMSGMRKAIAENMVRSFYEAPHASLICEIDVTEIMEIVQREKEPFLQKHKAKLSITAFIAKAIVEALQEYPLLNASLQQEVIHIKKEVNLGIAVSIPQAVIVPVIKRCQKLSLAEIAKAIHELSNKARGATLQPDDVAEGSITLTNFGMTGVQIGIPIIRYPEAAIIGVGGITKKVVVLKDDLFGVRQMAYLSLTFDHRLIDGIYGCGFLSSMKKKLEEPKFVIE